MIAVLVGLKGSGKTTLMKKLLKKRPDIKHIVAGDYFLEYYKQRGLNRDQGDLQFESSEHFRIQKEIFKEIKKECEKHENVIVDTHAFLTKKEGFYPGLPLFVLEELKPDVIIGLEYNPEEILKRREKDIKQLGRKRSVATTLRGVKLEYQVQRNYVFIASAIIGCTVKLLQRFEPEKHEFEHAEKNAGEIIKLFE